jgi:putative ATP-binding cassette transporter
MRLCQKIIAAPLRHLEELGSHKLMTALTDDIPTITGTLVNIPILCINMAIAVGGLVYLGLLSPIVLFTVLVFLALGVVTYQIPVIKAVRRFREARIDAENLMKHFRSLIDGSKELKLHSSRRVAFFTDFLQASASSLRDRNISATTIYIAAASWGQILVFVVIGLILFALPALQSVDTLTLTGYTITLLYLMTPLQVIMNTVPGLSRASVSLNRVEELGLTLDSFGSDSELSSRTNVDSYCDRLDLLQVTHRYQNEGHKDTFVLGPIDITLEPGELIFLVGGNGSGKTTLAKLLAGLYVPESGEVRLNGQPITDDNRERYRQLFTVVFSDFHLFDSLLGLEDSNIDERARDCLIQLELDNKLEINDGVLSTTNLSQGQRKRLALLTAYMEDRAIYVFDEWAADQDPMFKRVFYYHLLPDLKARGKMVLVISHDDQYYHVADRIVKLEYGKIEYDRANVNVQHAMAGIPMV